MVVVALAPLEPEAAARASVERRRTWSVTVKVGDHHHRGRGRAIGQLTLAEGVADGDDLALIDAGGTGLVGAVVHAVAEVHVGAETGDVVGLAAEGLRLAQHVVDAGFLRRPQQH